MSSDAAAALITEPFLVALREICDLSPLAEAELLITGWGCPPLDESTLDAAPLLRAVMHTAGSVRGHITEACWERGIEVSSAASVNALPVAEYTLATILLSGKHVLERSREYRSARQPPGNWLHTPAHVGNYRKTVGILSASMTGRRVIELLRPFDFQVLLYDPYVSEKDAVALGVRTVSLAELFAHSDIVSVHAPLLPATEGLVSRGLLATMRPSSVLINTARGAIVDQDALTEVLCEGQIRAVLDVTEPEILPPDHPLWTCDNALLTPHVAGSQGNEWQRLTELAVTEIRRWAAGDGFAHPVKRERLAFLA